MQNDDILNHLSGDRYVDSFIDEYGMADELNEFKGIPSTAVKSICEKLSLSLFESPFYLVQKDNRDVLIIEIPGCKKGEADIKFEAVEDKADNYVMRVKFPHPAGGMREASFKLILESYTFPSSKSAFDIDSGMLYITLERKEKQQVNWSINL